MQDKDKDLDMITLIPIVEESSQITLIKQGTILTQELLKSLNKLNNSTIWFCAKTQKHRMPQEDIIKKYIKYITTLKQIIGDEGNITDEGVLEIRELALQIIKDIQYEQELFKCIGFVKNLKDSLYMHLVDVAIIATTISTIMEYDKEKVEQIVVTALLHDIGKFELDSHVLHKNEIYTLKETLEYQRHPMYGYDKLKDLTTINEDILKAILTHHERCDQSGYLISLVGNKINDISRVIAIADEYNELRLTNHIFQIAHILKREYIKRLDSKILVKFINHIVNYYIGRKVELNTGEVGIIEAIQQESIHRPILNMGGYSVNLYREPKLHIIKVD